MDECECQYKFIDKRYIFSETQKIPGCLLTGSRDLFCLALCHCFDETGLNGGSFAALQLFSPAGYQLWPVESQTSTKNSGAAVFVTALEPSQPGYS